MAKEFSIEQLSNEPNQIDMLIKVCSEALQKEIRPIILFGSGKVGTFYLKYIKNSLKNVEKVFFCDNDSTKWGKHIQGVLVISPEQLHKQFSKSYIIITTLSYFEEIYKQLEEFNLESNILVPSRHVITDAPEVIEPFHNYIQVVKENLSLFQTAYGILEDELSKSVFIDRINYLITANSKFLTPLISKEKQYFDKGLIQLSKEEIFIDGGAYIGDTLEEFKRQTKGYFNGAYSFEPEVSKHNEIEKIIDGDKRIKLKPFGLWSSSRILKFSANGDDSSGLTESGDIEIPVVSIDEVLEGAPATYIKLDVEGAEIEALMGAEETIRRYKPRLAICVYHKPLDLVEIPLLLKSFDPGYKLYLRHYSEGLYETVCYAVPNNEDN